MLDQKASHLAGGVTRVEKAKIGLIQFCISPPKTDVRDSAHMQTFPEVLFYHMIIILYKAPKPCFRSLFVLPTVATE